MMISLAPVSSPGSDFASDRIRDLLDCAYERLCFICGHPGRCRHREPQVEIAILMAGAARIEKVVEVEVPVSQPMMRIELVKIAGPSTLKRKHLTLVSPPFPEKNDEIRHDGSTWLVTRTELTRGVAISTAATK